MLVEEWIKAMDGDVDGGVYRQMRKVILHYCQNPMPLGECRKRKKKMFM